MVEIACQAPRLTDDSKFSALDILILIWILISISTSILLCSLIWIWISPFFSLFLTSSIWIIISISISLLLLDLNLDLVVFLSLSH